MRRVPGSDFLTHPSPFRRLLRPPVHELQRELDAGGHVWQPQLVEVGAQLR